MLHYTSCGLDNVYLVNGFIEIDTPYGKATSIENIEGLHAAIAQQLANSVGQMNGQTFRYLRKYADMGQKAIGDLMGVGESTVSNWERGTTPVHGAAAELVKAMVRELVAGNADIAGAVDRYNHLDRERIRHELSFAESEGDWALAA